MIFAIQSSSVWGRRFPTSCLWLSAVLWDIWAKGSSSSERMWRRIDEGNQSFDSSRFWWNLTHGTAGKLVSINSVQVWIYFKKMLFYHELEALNTRLRFFRHIYQLLLKFNRREPTAASTNVSALIEEILKSIHICREALNSNLQTISLGLGFGSSFSFNFCLIKF